MSMTRAQTVQILRELSLAYPMVEFTKERAELWHKHLCELEYEDVVQATDEYIRSETKYPAIADIYQRAVKIREKREKAEKAKRDAAIVEEMRRRDRERIDETIRELLESVRAHENRKVEKVNGSTGGDSARSVQ
ncbi:replicative helicase loader/inhibitor [Alicyclobacillus vulcanalis]|uniref:Loader and inhibitor of phage G40P n=1 Tax=Alicyclobacillus vulcanalis TaxID=252246 RepID=A0A1N7MRW5_9BACL|nr:replicative helicase loader/inhibitor [Alicyclobacillus vulcanalis]SIS88866.1 Loader and inhibitor of phage G40P [Alicyclobacillus vulcanalis]